MSSAPLLPPHYEPHESAGCITLVYATSPSGLDIKLDVRLPPRDVLASRRKLPVIVSFHGGALFIGSRRDPHMDTAVAVDLLKSGCLILFPDYRMLDPCSSFAHVQDVKALVKFLNSNEFAQSLPEGVEIDTDRVATIGFSAGAYMARLMTIELIQSRAAGTSSLKPAACVSYFGMGGDYLLDYWLTKKPSAEPKPQHLVDGTTLPELADCPYSPSLDGYENTPVRASWCKWWWDSGNFLDLCTGKPGFALSLRSVAYKNRESTLAKSNEAPLFPQLFLASSPLANQWPETLLVHGSGDPIVPYAESIHTLEQLEQLNVPAQLVTIPNGDHDLVDADTGKAIIEKLDAFKTTVDFLIGKLV